MCIFFTQRGSQLLVKRASKSFEKLMNINSTVVQLQYCDLQNCSVSSFYNLYFARGFYLSCVGNKHISTYVPVSIVIQNHYINWAQPLLLPDTQMLLLFTHTSTWAEACSSFSLHLFQFNCLIYAILGTIWRNDWGTLTFKVPKNCVGYN